MGNCLSCGDREEEQPVRVRGLEIGSPQQPETSANLEQHNLQPIRRHDGTVPTENTVRHVDRIMQADLGELSAAAVAASDDGQRVHDPKPTEQHAKQQSTVVPVDEARKADDEVAAPVAPGTAN
ncbi:hypothetical protein AJ79_03435 [Helicocarpus griseus UAMH5409]|uniref:Uncharacterized protein n=1 Tax=Helicocarpus griseus UAMH5409 TaxID=1447875 RepID=A0A2B7XX00_9EURO|nr:hypothetical protein AJ79_03435 [Helicocarpus griseus UAMH5409]